MIIWKGKLRPYSNAMEKTHSYTLYLLVISRGGLSLGKQWRINAHWGAKQHGNWKHIFKYTESLPLCSEMLGWKLFWGHHTKKNFASLFLGLTSPITPHNEQVWRVGDKLGFFRNRPPIPLSWMLLSFPFSTRAFYYCWVYLLDKEIWFPYNSLSGVSQIFTSLD